MNFDFKALLGVKGLRIIPRVLTGKCGACSTKWVVHITHRAHCFVSSEHWQSCRTICYSLTELLLNSKTWHSFHFRYKAKSGLLTDKLLYVSQ